MLKVPLLMGVGDKDELFAVDSVKEFCEGINWNNKECIVIKDGHHTFFPKGSWTPLVQWLMKNFPQS